MSYGHKKQHTIPESYLKAWCDRKTPEGHEPYVWVISKDGQKTKKKAPTNVFTETDFYTIKKIDGTRDLVLEHGLQQLESKFATVRRNTLEPMADISPEDRITLCAFTAAMHARTKAQREHTRNQWTPILDMMKSMQSKSKTMTPEERDILAAHTPPSSEEGGIRIEDVENIVENPMQSMLGLMVEVETPLLIALDMAVLHTQSVPGFITSDRPCVWFDPEAYKRPPYYRIPALMYESIEITLPISPSYVLLLNRQGFNGYKATNKTIVDEFNRRIRFHCYEYLVASRNEQDPYWFVVDPRKG